MRRTGYVVKRLAVAPKAVNAIRRNALAQAREPPAPAWRKWLGLEKELKEGVDGGPHGRLLIPLAPDDVGDVLTKALAAVGRGAVADVGLTSKALLVELSVLAVLPRAAAQPPHLDVLPRDGLAMATLFIPLQDVCASNGATVLYPAPPSEVEKRRDWARLHKDDDPRTYAPDGAEDISDAATIQAEAAGLLPPVASPWSKFSPSELGLGEPACLEMRVGDVALMDYRCFHRGGANVSEDLRCVMYATFSSEGDHHSYSVEASAQTRRLGEFLAVGSD